MASPLFSHSSSYTSLFSPKSYQTLPHFTKSKFLSPISVLSLKHRSLLYSRFNFAPLKTRRVCPTTVVLAVQSNFVKVLQTIWNTGKDGIEAGTNLVPESIPRPVARISVTIVALTVSLFVLKSFLSTAFFVLGTMGLAYFLFIALNKDQVGSRSPGGSNSDSSSTKRMEDPVEEARKIMEKYK